MNLLFLDLELNQPSTKIIQVGYVIANPNEWLIKRSIYVNPHEKLDPRIIDLTGITQEQVDFGFELSDAYQEICRDVVSFGCFINPVTWGGGDSEHLKKELGKGDEFIFGRRWIDAKTLFVAWALANGKPPMGGLSSSLKKFRLKFEGKRHDALDDAYNTMRIFWELLKYFEPSRTGEKIG